MKYILYYTILYKKTFIPQRVCKNVTAVFLFHLVCSSQVVLR